MTQFEYIEIGDDGKSMKIWINRPYNVDGNSFKTRTILDVNNRNPDYYHVTRERTVDIYNVTAKQKMTFYVRCEEYDAEIIVLPYYMGHAFEHIVKVVDSDKSLFIVKERMPLTRVQQTIEEINNDEPMKYVPKLNEILGYNAIEWVDDKNTLIQIQNGGVIFIKEYKK